MSYVWKQAQPAEYRIYVEHPDFGSVDEGFRSLAAAEARKAEVEAWIAAAWAEGDRPKVELRRLTTDVAIPAQKVVISDASGH